MNGGKSNPAGNPAGTVRRAALYIRVSTEEQARHGYSLEAQREDLERYAKSHGYTVAGLYVDDGASARKRYTTRKGFMRLLADVRAGRIDTVLFIKLDRWFRNVADYHEIQKVLDAHGVTWEATQERYETATPEGRFTVNIMLAVAQDESDRTSQRIKFVNESKIARGEVVTGSTPIGYKVQDHHLVIDEETADAARDMFHYYLSGNSLRETSRYMRRTYHAALYPYSVRSALTNTLYKGQYRDNPAYCEPLISPADWDAVQNRVSNRYIRRNQTGRVYIFSGLLICSECGHRLAGRYQKVKEHEYIYYRCSKAKCCHECSHLKEVREDVLENWLWEHIPGELDAQEMEWQVKAKEAARKPVPDRAAIQRKLSRLKDLYVNDMIDMTEYKADYDRYTVELTALEAEAVPEERRPDISGLRKLFVSGARVVYDAMDRTCRQNFWRGVLDHAAVTPENHVIIFFR